MLLSPGFEYLTGSTHVSMQNGEMVMLVLVGSILPQGRQPKIYWFIIIPPLCSDCSSRKGSRLEQQQ